MFFHLATSRFLTLSKSIWETPSDLDEGDLPATKDFLHNCLADVLKLEGLGIHSNQGPAWCLDVDPPQVETLQLLGVLSESQIYGTYHSADWEEYTTTDDKLPLWHQLLRLANVDPPVARPSTNQVWFTQWTEIPNPVQGVIPIFIYSVAQGQAVCHYLSSIRVLPAIQDLEGILQLAQNHQVHNSLTVLLCQVFGQQAQLKIDSVDVHTRASKKFFMASPPGDTQFLVLNISPFLMPKSPWRWATLSYLDRRLSFRLRQFSSLS